MTTYTFATWNVNSLKIRLPQVLDWFESRNVDAVVLQETKTVDENFPLQAFQEAGIDAAFIGQKSYNGVALLTRQGRFDSVQTLSLNLPGHPDEQKRFIAQLLTPQGLQTPICFCGAYIPMGQQIGASKFLYKLDWLHALQRVLAQYIQAYPLTLIGGDFNIAPEDKDTWSPGYYRTTILSTPAERRIFKDFAHLGLVDLYRHFDPLGKAYTWWDYRQNGFERNHGVRIDHLLATKALQSKAQKCVIDREPRSWDQPSDHTPVMVTFDFSD